jgi:hypothetical protein
MHLTEPAIAVAAPVERCFRQRKALWKVAVKYDFTYNRNCMMNTTIDSTKYKQFWVIIGLAEEVMLGNH